MREILFKAKRLDNGKWVEGYYYSYETLECFEKGYKYHYILKPGFADWSMPRPAEFYEIDPNTLCQFTGFTDKDGDNGKIDRIAAAAKVRHNFIKQIKSIGIAL